MTGSTTTTCEVCGRVLISSKDPYSVMKASEFADLLATQLKDENVELETLKQTYDSLRVFMDSVTSEPSSRCPRSIHPEMD